MKIKSKIGALGRLRPSGAVFLLTLAALGTVLTSVAGADTIVRGFNAATSIAPGWVVALSQGQTNSVELAPAGDSSRIYGVVIDPSQAPVTLQPNQGRRVFVATSGTYPVLVSAINGSINSGDYISMSSADGIAAKATSSEAVILGQATQKFDGTNNVITKGANGDNIGRIETNITPRHNPLSKNLAAIPAPLRRAGEAIAGKNVSAVRIYAALLVFLVTAVIAISLLVVGVRSGLVSIGRNPLSRHSIFQGLFQVVLVALAVFVIGVFAVYLLLKL
jgi:hypothetical protein